MTNSPPHTQKPTEKQLRYLRDLAASRGETFTMPQTRAEASAEIERLKGRRALSHAERRIEADAQKSPIADRWPSATAIRPEEIEGYGSSARWA